MRGLATLPPSRTRGRARDSTRARATRGWPALHAELAARRSRGRRAHPARRRAAHPARAGGLRAHRRDDQRPAAARRRAPACACRRTSLMPLTRDELYQRLDRRFDAMLAAGFVEEVRTLHAPRRPGRPTCRACAPSAIGSSGPISTGECRSTDAVAAAKRATRNLAKRQLTWLRAEPAIPWIGRT